MYALLEQAEVAPWVLHMPKGMDWTDDQFFEFCVLNRELLRIERTAEGEILIMSPTGARGSNQNLQISVQLYLWAERDGTGVAFDSNGGFTLPNHAMRARRTLLGWLDIGWHCSRKRKEESFCPFVLISWLNYGPGLTVSLI